jgi:hypothetical protein
MGAQDEQYADVANSIVNNSLQNIANFCSITCNDNISNLDVVLIGGNDTININQSCSVVGAECVIKNVMNTEIENLINNVINQTGEAKSIFSLFGPSSSEDVNITNSMKNQVSQLISNTCAIGVNNNITNVSVIAQDANLNLSLAQTGSVNKAECIIDTVSKLLINNDIQNNVKQEQSGLSLGGFLAIIILISIIAILVIVIPYLTPITTEIGSFISGGK